MKPCNPQRLVRRSVIHYDSFKISIRLTFQRLDAVGDVGFYIEGGNNNGKPHRSGPFLWEQFDHYSEREVLRL